MATQAWRENTLKAKIDDLNKVRKQIDDQVDQMTRLGTSWISSQGMKGSFQCINAQLESSLDLLHGVLEQMVGAEPTPGSFTPEGRSESPVASGTSMEEMLNRMDSLERKGIALQSQMDETMKNLEHEKNGSERLLAEAEAQYGQVDKRVQELEKWRLEERKELDKLHAKLQKISASAEGGAVGAGPFLKQKVHCFAASLPPDSQPVGLTVGQTVTCFTEVSKNTGDHYDPIFGIYTVPVSGVYKITLSHSQHEEAGRYPLIFLNVVCESHAGERSKSMRCMAQTNSYTRYNTKEVQEKLRAADRLWVEVFRIESNARLTPPCRFACVLWKAD